MPRGGRRYPRRRRHVGDEKRVLRCRSAPLDRPSRPSEKGRTSRGRLRGRARAVAAGKGEREPRPPERESASRGRRRGRARAAAAGEGEREPRLPGFAAGEGEPESPPSGFAAGRERETERKKKNGRDGRETSSSWMPVRDKVWYFSVLPLYFF